MAALGGPALHPRLRNRRGPVALFKNAHVRPGRMTDFIRGEGLLPCPGTRLNQIYEADRARRR